MENVKNVISHLVEVEGKAAMIVEAAQKEADKLLMTAKSEADREYKKLHKDLNDKYEGEYERFSSEIKSRYQNMYDEYKKNVETVETDEAALKAKLEEILSVACNECAK